MSAEHQLKRVFDRLSDAMGLIQQGSRKANDEVLDIVEELFRKLHDRS